MNFHSSITFITFVQLFLILHRRVQLVVSQWICIYIRKSGNFIQYTFPNKLHSDDLVCNWGNFSASAIGLLQSFAKPSIWYSWVSWLIFFAWLFQTKRVLSGAMTTLWITVRWRVQTMYASSCLGSWTGSTCGDPAQTSQVVTTTSTSARHSSQGSLCR